MEDEIVTHSWTQPYTHTHSSSLSYQCMCIFYLQIMFCLFLCAIMLLQMEKRHLIPLSGFFLAAHFFCPGSYVSVCVCVCVCNVGWHSNSGRQMVIPPSLSDHVEHCLERSSKQKMDFISACITGFKVQQVFCNLKALCIILH